MKNKIASALMMAAAVLYVPVASAAIIELTSQLTAAQEIPAVQGTGKGTLRATLDTATSQLHWSLSYSGMTGPLISGHFHGPASKTEVAAPSVGFKGNLDSPITGEATLTPVQMGELIDGKWYVNLHTAMHPKGEIRGQVTAK